MAKKPARTKQAGLSRRLHFPEDERGSAWLPLLLDAYAVADTGVAVAIRDREKRGKGKLACGKGCGACCEHQQDLPLYPHELVGIYWYVSEKTTPPLRDILENRLAAHTRQSPCPFLVEGACAIHPLRPVGCRQFNVFGRPCGPGEDPYYTRRDDVLVPQPDYTDRAFASVLPFYRMKNEGDVSASISLVRKQIMNLKEFDWKKLVTIMEQVDSRKSG